MGDLTGFDRVSRNLDAYASGLKAGATLAAQEIATLLEGYAKANHPWTPRTGNTTNSIRGTVVEASADMVRIVLSAGMDYDLFLEVCHDGRWAWLWPAIVANKDSIRNILKKRLSDVKVNRT